MSPKHEEGRNESASPVDELKEQVGTVRKDVGELGRVARAAAGETIEDARSTAQDKMGDVRDKAKHYVETGREKAEVYEERVTKYVRAQPLKSVAMAAGIGFLLGFVRRR